MHRTPVTSSNILSIGYDSQSRILEIEFVKTGIYCYEQVPLEIYKEFLNAESCGKYFEKKIKSNFTFTKI
jgi:hypothetical protein